MRREQRCRVPDVPDARGRATAAARRPHPRPARRWGLPCRGPRFSIPSAGAVRRS